MKKQTVGFVLGMALAAMSLPIHGQTAPPLTMTTTMDCSHPEGAATMVVKNSSTQPVLAYVILVDKLCFERHEMYRHDFFFKAHGFQVGESLPVQLGKMGTEIEGVQPRNAPLEAKILFVQFADGTKWGDDPAAGTALLSQRVIVEEFLERLKAASGDPQRFRDILGEPQKPATSVWATSEHLNLLVQQFGLNTVINDVNERLEIARQRQSFLK